MKKNLILLYVLFYYTSVFSQQLIYSRVKIFLENKDINSLSKIGLALDHGELKAGNYFIGEFSSNEINLLKINQFKFEVLINDLTSYYQERNNLSLNKNKSEKDTTIIPYGNSKTKNNYTVPSNFRLGKMGGYYTFLETLAIFDTMVRKWPNLIKQLEPISYTIKTDKNNYVFWTRISNNPNTKQNNKPKLLLTALHHAREPISVSQLVMFIYYLLENYETNNEVKYLVDNTEIYFIPVVNPDGYLYNESIAPQGGGMWRKNRKRYGGFDDGVDINRNYGFNWGFDTIGSSNESTSEINRGFKAFSEPETKCVKLLCDSNDFKIVLNYHSYGNLVVYPWGYSPNIQTPDSTYFVQLSKYLTEENKFVYGTGKQTLGYLANGNSDDWMYGEQIGKQKMFALTPEIGNSEDGFWPSMDRIVPLCISTVRQNMNAMKSITNYALIEDSEKDFIPIKKAYLNYHVKRVGLQNNDTFYVTVKSISSNIVINQIAPKVYYNLPLFIPIEDSVEFFIKPNIENTDTIIYSLSITNKKYQHKDTIYKYYGWTLNSNGIEFTKNYSLIGYPNPTQNNVTIKYKLPDNLVNAKLKMIDMFGKEIKQIDLLQGEGELFIDISDLSNGIYMYKIDAINFRSENLKIVLIK